MIYYCHAITRNQFRDKQLINQFDNISKNIKCLHSEVDVFTITNKIINSKF